ncbi:MAG: glycerol kinase GlpK [Gemmatimonadetes bacterium]|nr:glycerol kinase GlpK [Gemmatimonadota bacterium]
MPRRAVAAIDQGTTGSTVLVVGDDGRVLARAYSEFTQHFPRPGWVEHDAEEIWSVTRSVLERARAGAKAADARIEAIGITNQRETIVVWDRATLAPVHRAIVWQDRRTTDLCRDLREAGHEDEVRRRTGLVLDPYFSATKLMWLFEQHPELRRRAEAGDLACGTIDSWLIARLTRGEVHATDPTNASRTLLYDLGEQDWADPLLGLFGVPRPLLPEVRRSSGDFGVAAGQAAGIEVPILGVAGDQQAALFGQGCWRPGLAKNTYGTGAFLLMHTGDRPVPSEHGLLTTAAVAEDGGVAYALEGSVFIAGAALQWLRDGLGLLEKASDSEQLAASLDDNDGVYLVPAFVGLGAPHWDPNARGTVVGLTRGSTRAHLARAALEAMAYATHEVLQAMVADSSVPLTELRVDGGASANDWLMGFQAGVLGVPVLRPPIVETTGLGAAALAGLGSGVWADAQAFREALGSPTRFEPTIDEASRERWMAGWARAVRAARAWSSEG